MRKYIRYLAKVRMKDAGLVRICKKFKGGNDSYFALHWRDWI